MYASLDQRVIKTRDLGALGYAVTADLIGRACGREKFCDFIIPTAAI